MVMRGYKTSEVGVIPEDWEIVPLLKKCRLLNGLTYTPDNVKERGLLVLRSSNIQDGALSFEDNVYVDCTVSDEKIVTKGDILICVRNGSADLLGKCALIDKHYHATFGAFMAILRGPHNPFIIQVLQRGIIQKEIIRKSTTSINQITNKDFSSIKIGMPSDEIEEREISQTLRDVDELIVLLEKTIQKKTNIKHGAMQELLSGRKRLPGFTGQWIDMVIGEQGGLQKTSINPQLQPNTFFYEYSMPAFDDGKKPHRVQGLTMHSNRTVIRDKVLLFNKLNVRQKRVWFIEKCEDNAVCSAEFLPYYSETIDLELLSQILLTDEVTKDFIGMSTGTSNSQKRITPKSFMEYSINLPEDICEQKALARMFRDMDHEIELLRRKLSKCRQLKVGMMQKLLAGEIRLVSEV